MPFKSLKSVLFEISTFKSFKPYLLLNNNLPRKFASNIASSKDVSLLNKKSIKTQPSSTQKVISFVPAGTILKGINIFKNGSDPIAKLDEEYPDWLWDLLDEKKQNVLREHPHSRPALRQQRKQLIKNNNFDKSRKK